MSTEIARVQNIEMTHDQYKVIQKFLEFSSGIVLGEGKQYLVKNRLSDLVFKYCLNSFDELATSLQTDTFAARKIKAAVVDAMTTNETFWFRDDAQFLELKEKILPELLKAKGTVRIWSAACSSGQEPYSISICAEALARMGISGNVQIVGTDISDSVLTEAKKAVYSEMVLARGLDSYSKTNYFQAVDGGYQLCSEIVKRVKFQQFNLLDSFAGLGRFDIIFCRNVLIYFSADIKHSILQRMASALASGGYLFLSSTEAMPADLVQYESVRGGRVRYFKKAG